ncbi:MAG: type II toxin-antitoxin system VapC family toxin [Verrucomicrobiota bacterium]
MILVDTTFLIDLQRGARNKRREEAEAWVDANAHEELGIPAIVLGEFAEGFDDEDDPLLMGYRTGHRVFFVDERVAARYGVISRSLRAAGLSIGTNDTWIAATALAWGLPLLTRNVEHFGRVPGLAVVGYGG